MGFLIIFPYTRKLILKKISIKFKNEKVKKNDFIDGEFEDIDDNDDKKF